MVRSLILALAALVSLSPTIASAQVVTITAPRTVNPDGQPIKVPDVFIRNADGTIASLGTATTPRPGLDLDQYSTSIGRSFSVGTGIVSIPANNVLNVVYTCNAPTGSLCHVYARRFGNGSGTTLQYQNFRNPTAISGGTTKVAGNKLVGSANTSTSNITYATGTAAIATGTPAITDFVYPNDDTLISYMTSLPPGGTIGVTISGASGALSGATLASVLFVAYEGAL